MHCEICVRVGVCVRDCHCSVVVVIVLSTMHAQRAEGKETRFGTCDFCLLWLKKSVLSVSTIMMGRQTTYECTYTYMHVFKIGMLALALVLENVV